MDISIKKEISIDELRKVKDKIEKAISPLVLFYAYIDKMREQRDQERERILYWLLRWIDETQK